MAIFTSGSKSMMHLYDLEGARKVLYEGGVVLLPTDTVWSVAGLASSPGAVAKLKSLTQQTQEYSLELLVSSIEMLKQYVEELHPRLETLLLYHTRPLSILFDNPAGLGPECLSDEGEVSIRLVRDEFSKMLISDMGEGLISCPASIGNGFFPVNFGAVSSEILQGVDYVAKFRQGDKRADELSVLVKLSEMDELEFLRE